MPMGPLKNIRVVELAGIGPGPMCAMLLADLGADVVRVDRTEPSGLGSPTDPRFDVTNRGKRSIAVNLKNPEGREIVFRLIKRADVLIEGFRPGVMERLGIGPDACRAINPRLVYGRMTGFGQDGALAQAAGHDLNYIALTGALHAIGPRNGPPIPPLNLIGDYGGGALYLAFGIASALVERQQSGEGQVVDAAMVEGAASLMSVFYGRNAAGLWSEKRGANILDGGAPYYCVYETLDGRYVSIAAIEGKFFAELAERIGLPESFVSGQNDRSLWPEMKRRLEAIFRTKTRDEWCALLEGTDACFAPVLTVSEAPRHKHNVSRDVFVEVGGYLQPAPAPRFSRSITAKPGAVPGIGAQTDEVLAEIGCSAADITALRTVGAIK
jgi:alpha-methylacyl-CoA racemase